MSSPCGTSSIARLYSLASLSQGFQSCRTKPQLEQGLGDVLGVTQDKAPVRFAVQFLREDNGVTRHHNGFEHFITPKTRLTTHSTAVGAQQNDSVDVRS